MNVAEYVAKKAELEKALEEALMARRETEQAVKDCIAREARISEDIDALGPHPTARSVVWHDEKNIVVWEWSYDGKNFKRYCEPSIYSTIVDHRIQQVLLVNAPNDVALRILLLAYPEPVGACVLNRNGTVHNSVYNYDYRTQEDSRKHAREYVDNFDGPKDAILCDLFAIPARTET